MRGLYKKQKKQHKINIIELKGARLAIYVVSCIATYEGVGPAYKRYFYKKKIKKLLF